ncbi:MAG: hypothetical protein IPI58_04150 [Alphaproteobacteria bacterium]|nr:MAG: hypothetical protein IPI58_04150 [Alphaproteobacteria bacterium]
MTEPSDSCPPPPRKPKPKTAESEHVTTLARAHTAKAIAALAEILHDEDDPRIRVAAARALLERGWGRPAAMNEDETSMNETDATQREQAGQEAYRLLEQLASHKRGGGARPDAVDQDGAARTADARGGLADMADPGRSRLGQDTNGG